jgi:hypothetical protein
MQKIHQSVKISQLSKQEAFRVCENLIEDTLDDQLDDSGLVAKLQVIGYEVVDTVYKLYSNPEFGIGFQIDHGGVGFIVEFSSNEFEDVAKIFTDEKSADVSLKLKLITDEIRIDESSHSLRFIFESRSLYRQLANSRINTLKKYLEPEQKTIRKTHDSF